MAGYRGVGVGVGVGFGEQRERPAREVEREEEDAERLAARGGLEARVEARALLALEVRRHRLRALERRARRAKVARVPLADARQRDGRGAAARAHLHAVPHEGARGRLQLRVEPGALEDLHGRRVAARAAVERERDARVNGGGVQGEGVARARDDEARQKVGRRRAVG